MSSSALYSSPLPIKATDGNGEEFHPVMIEALEDPARPGVYRLIIDFDTSVFSEVITRPVRR